jgi:mRNA interferase RelE/StbE
MLYKLLVDERAIKELGNPKHYPPKVYRQLTLKIFTLQLNPRPPDSKKIGEGYRVDVGEYRIYYEVDDQARVVAVYVIGKRGDDEIYRKLKRL